MITIGIDPHKSSLTAVAVDPRGNQQRVLRLAVTKTTTEQQPRGTRDSARHAGLPRRVWLERRSEEAVMAAGDKIRGRARATTGRAKQGLGEAAGDQRLAREGQAQRRRGNLRLALEKLKDAFRR